jgi:hypothetical protein
VTPKAGINSTAEHVRFYRALVPEVLVNGDQYAVVRPRIEVEALIAMDKPAPWL